MNLENNEEFQELREDQQEIVEMLLDINVCTDIEEAIMACDDVIGYGKVTKEEYARACLEDRAEMSKDIEELLPYINYDKYAKDITMDLTEYNGNLYYIP